MPPVEAIGSRLAGLGLRGPWQVGAEAGGHSLHWLSRATQSTSNTVVSFMVLGARGAPGTEDTAHSLGLWASYTPPSPLPRAGPPPRGPPEKGVVCSANKQSPGQLPAQAGGPWEVHAPHLPGVRDFLLARSSVRAAARLGFVCTGPTQASALPMSFLERPHLASTVWGRGAAGEEGAGL